MYDIVFEVTSPTPVGPIALLYISANDGGPDEPPWVQKPSSSEQFFSSCTNQTS